MTTFLVFTSAAAVCLAVLGAYIRWDYVQDRKDVWDWPEPEPFEPMPTDWQEAYHYSRSGTPPPASRLPEPEPSPVQTALDEADAAIREWDTRPEPTQREVHWQPPGRMPSLGDIVDSVGACAVRLARAAEPVGKPEVGRSNIRPEQREIHWQAPGTTRRIKGAVHDVTDAAGRYIARYIDPTELRWRAV